ncbi:rhamnulokinase [Clostridium fallax]|uniref:Rhamnulokinase n=1 Tax=Clostridium fallax TaxID=1533 RepID=A0A1M4XCL4_9CLOT|nr:rhamnulokinase family protein [Clostridium fallax]SHE91145.1 rhamnulokinase [Clostridium fallax]SQB05981.1 L-fuculokinase [Clostridium fallax]
MGVYLAFDFGASSGRAIIVNVNNEKIDMKEIHRFSNEPVYLNNKYLWDFQKLFNEMKKALKKVSLLDEKIQAIGIDTWGVDYGLLDNEDNLIGIPMHYRDERNYFGIDEVEKSISIKNLYKKTGIASMAFNTVFQLVADKKFRKSILENSNAMLFMPDLFAYYLTGEKRTEFTIASTSGLLDLTTRQWNYKLIESLNLPKNIFQKIIEPGNFYGYLSDSLIEELDLYKIPVIAVGGHDTASAVVATPFVNSNYAFLSSGTWSLLGKEIDSPIINEKSYDYGFTNEGGVANKIRLLKNINGLWLIQQLKKNWCENYEEIGFKDIIKAARKTNNTKFQVDTNDKEFMNSKNMIESIKKYCIKRNQGEPKTLGELAIAIYNGLSKEYLKGIEELEDILGYKIEGINVVGGGIQDDFLCELTAKNTCKKVVTGPVEAAVLGNVLMQMIALKEIKSIEEGRKIISKSFDFKIYF